MRSSLVLFILLRSSMVRAISARCQSITSPSDLASYTSTGDYTFCGFNFTNVSCDTVTIDEGATVSWTCNNGEECKWICDKGNGGHLKLEMDTDFTLEGDFTFGGASNSFSIEQGQTSSTFTASGTTWQSNSYGVILSNGRVTLTNVEFTNNGNANAQGGCLQITGGDAAIVDITDSTFHGNVAGSGGAIYTVSGNTITLTNVKFEENTAYNGGAIADVGNPVDYVMNSVTFTQNEAEPDDKATGGALVFSTKGTATLKDCKFESNLSSGYGGAIAVYDGTVTLESCDFTDNDATGPGTMIYLNGGSVTGQCDGTNVKDNGVCNGIYDAEEKKCSGC